MKSSEKKKERILLVEDDLTFGTGLVKALESEIKEHVIWTKTLAETLPYLYGDQYCYSAAVLDFVLPDAMNGEIIDIVVITGEFLTHLWQIN